MHVSFRNSLGELVLQLYIVELCQSVNEKNFRYTGARMCGHLMAHLQPAFGARFQSFLIARYGCMSSCRFFYLCYYYTVKSLCFYINMLIVFVSALDLFVLNHTNHV